MKKYNPKIMFIVIGLLLTCNVTYGQNTPSVRSLSIDEFARKVRNTDSATFKTWMMDKTETRNAIIRLDIIISSVNSLILDNAYDSLKNLAGDETLDDLITDFNKTLIAIEKSDAKKETKQKLKSTKENITIRVSSINDELLYSLSKLCGIMESKTKESISINLSNIENRETPRDLYKYYDNWNDTSSVNRNLSPYEAFRNLSLIGEQLEIIDKRILSMYASSTSKRQKIKSVEVNHGNDFFVPGLNQDREMTGSFRLSVTTDYFKAKFLNFGDIFKKTRNADVLSYQTLSFGGIGYTPYIRYQDNIELADTFHKYDRPFGSFVFVSRSKNRLWQKGLVRHMGELQFGFVGLEAPDAIQASLHKDFITSSQRVHGWDKQIGDPGRLALQLTHDFDFLLFSNTNKYGGLISTRKPNMSIQKYFGLNVIGSLEGKVGSYMTALGGGLRLSSLDFMNQSGQHIISPKKDIKCSYEIKNKELGIHFETGVKYRWVIHNAMLEGIGFLTPFNKDEFDIDPINTHVFSGNDTVRRHMLYVDWKFVFKYKNMAIYFQQIYHPLEYNIKPYDANSTEAYALLEGNQSIEDKRRDYYMNTTRKEYGSLYNRGWYGYGTVGVVWLIN